MNKCFLISLFLTICVISTAQVKLDIELNSGLILNGKTYDHIDEETSFDLKNGYSYGLGFDLWIKNNWAISFGYSLGQSRAIFKTNYPEGFRFLSRGHSAGVLKDRIFYLGGKKSFSIGEATSIEPFLGIYYNPFFFETDDMRTTYITEQQGIQFYEYDHHYARFNAGDSKLFGAYGGRLGLTIAQSVGNIGTFSLSMAYSLDATQNLRQVIFTETNYQIWNTASSTIEDEFYHFEYENIQRGRHLWQIELGFKMPCSVLLGK